MRFARILVYSLIGLFLQTFDFSGLGGASARYSESVFYHMVAPQYGTGRLAAAGASRSDGPHWNTDISVILLDDAALGKNDRSRFRGSDGRGISWPVPLAYHVALLSDLYETYRPNAIMVDILFLDRRDGDQAAVDAFVALIERIGRDPDARLYLAASNPARACTDVIGPVADTATLAAVAWRENDGEKPLYYPLATGAGLIRDGVAAQIFCDGSRTTAAAAFAMYRYLCLRAVVYGTTFAPNCAGLSVPRPLRDGLVRLRKIRSGGAVALTATDRKILAEHESALQEIVADWERQFALPMQTVWGVKAPQLNWEQADQGVFCRAQNQWLLRRGYDLLIANFLGNPASVRQTCPYPQVIKARDFMDGEFRSDTDVVQAFRTALAPEPDGPPKIVFYGASLVGARDAVQTPTHGKTPGVFLHAMALDNLLTFGAGYIRERDGFDPVLLSLNWGFALLVAIVSVLSLDLKARFAADGMSRVKRGALTVATLLTGWVVIGFVIYVSFYWLRLAPVNWLGFLGLTVVLQIPWVDSAISRIIGWTGNRLQKAGA